MQKLVGISLMVSGLVLLIISFLIRSQTQQQQDLNQNKKEMMKVSKLQKSKFLTIKEKCINQSKQFTKWDSQKSWKTFHSSHYDWWAFPIDNPSRSYRDAYQVRQKQKQALIKDEEFIQALKINAILVCRSWGWDLQKGENIKKAGSDQKWQRWPIRLSKMCRSLQIFQQHDLFKNAILYSNILLKDFKKFTYAGNNLTPYFEENYQSLFMPSVKKQNETKKQESTQKKESKTEQPDTKGQNSEKNLLSSKKQVIQQKQQQGQKDKNVSPKIQSYFHQKIVNGKSQRKSELF